MQTIYMYVPKESGMLKIHVQNLKSRIFDKVHLKVCFIDKNPLLRGWKLLNLNCVWRTKQQRCTKDMDTTLSTPFVNLYFDLFYVH